MEDEPIMAAGKDFVTCLNWVKIGVAKQQPVQVKYSKEELKEIIDNTRRTLGEEGNAELNAALNEAGVEDVEMQPEESGVLSNNARSNENITSEDAEIIDRYGLDGYDDSSDDEQRNIIGGFGNLVKHDSNENDPYLQPDSEDEESEAEDFNLNPNDNLLLVGRVQEDASSLEVYVYNTEDNYVHHDVYLPAFPMCIETISYNSKEQTACNWAAIGDMTKDICVWDVDVVNELEPIARLKGHKDAVLDLSWNTKTTNILASCSVDQTVHLWDLNNGKSIHKLKKFSNRVQTLKFNSQDEGKLLVGDCDGKITLVDCNALSMQTYAIPNNEIEKVLWSPEQANLFVVSTDKGTVHLYDSRVKNELQRVQAHDDSVTDLAFSQGNLLLSACADGNLKIWDLSANSFKLVDTYSESNVGRIFAISSNPDRPLTIAVGGDSKRKSIEVIDLSKLEAVKSYLNLP